MALWANNFFAYYKDYQRLPVYSYSTPGDDL